MDGAPGVDQAIFDAFISYRRADGAHFARRLRRRLQDFRAPAILGGRPLRIYLDTIYERATNDFYEGTIRPALLQSRFLIVVSTPQAADRGPAREDWIRREIEDFERGPNGGNVLVVATTDSVGTALPGNLASRYPNMEIIDLRGLHRFPFVNPMRVSRLTDETIKLVAPLFGVRQDQMPLLRREEERRQASRLGIVAGTFVAVVVSVLALSIWALVSRNTAVDAIRNSMFTTDRVIQSVYEVLDEGPARAELMRTSCDLLDSLQDAMRDEPRTGALVRCAIERSKSHEERGEAEASARLVNNAVALAEKQYAASTDADDATAILLARRTALERSQASPADRKALLSGFVERARQLKKDLPSEKSLANFAAEALQTQTERLSSEGDVRTALMAVDAAIALRELDPDERDNDPSRALGHIASLLLKARLLRQQGDGHDADEALRRAAARHSAIATNTLREDDMRQRYREAGDAIQAARKMLPK